MSRGEAREEARGEARGEETGEGRGEETGEETGEQGGEERGMGGGSNGRWRYPAQVHVEAATQPRKKGKAVLLDSQALLHNLQGEHGILEV